MAYNVFLVAGEASADLHGAHLVREFKRLHPDAKFFGVGGPELEKEGMEILVPSSQLSLVGISDWFDRFGEVLGLYRKVKNEVLRRRPDLAILLDLPDFNLSIAKHLKRIKTPVTYYISPQVWAWRKYRIKKIKNLVDQMLVVFPFEKEFYAKSGVNVEFVGHPLLETVRARTEFRSQSEISSAPRIAILPGSRRSEIRYHATLLERTVLQLLQQFPDAEIQVPIAPTLSLQSVEQSFGKSQDKVKFIEGDARDVMAWADVALVASGTATLECAMVGTPFCLFYIASPSSAWIFQNIIRYRDFIGMPNLLHRREVAREFFQGKAIPEALVKETNRLIVDEAYRAQMAQSLSECRDLLGKAGASQRAAYLAHRLLLETEKNRRGSYVVGGEHAPQAT